MPLSLGQQGPNPQQNKAEFSNQQHLGKKREQTPGEAPSFKEQQKAPKFSGEGKRVQAAQKDVKIETKKIAGQGGDTNVITETPHASNVATGASLGGTIGSYIPVVGTFVGAVVGGIVGGVAGLLS